MKKIVALVLSLVLALSLCATAFAFTAPTGSGVYYVNNGVIGNKSDLDLDHVKAVTYKDGTGYVEYYVDTWTAKEPAYKYVKEGSKDIYVLVANWPQDVPAGYEVYNPEGANVAPRFDIDVDHFRAYIPCEKADAGYVLYKNGSYSVWLKEAKNIDDDSEAYYAAIVTAQKATTAKPNCTTTQYLEDGYVDSDGNFYVDGNVLPVNYDGKIIWVADVSDDWDYVIHASHVFAKGVKSDKMGYDVATCLICKGEFACTNDEAVATKTGYKISTSFAYNNYDAYMVYDANKYNNGYDFNWGQTYATDYNYCWQLKPGTTEEIGTKPATDTKTGVDSAKTFDAGIAMYVGMSLLSVAGSAVVIGKKKEF